MKQTIIYLFFVATVIAIGINGRSKQKVEPFSATWNDSLGRPMTLYGLRNAQRDVIEPCHYQTLIQQNEYYFLGSDTAKTNGLIKFSVVRDCYGEDCFQKDIDYRSGDLTCIGYRENEPLIMVKLNNQIQRVAYILPGKNTPLIGPYFAINRVKESYVVRTAVPDSLIKQSMAEVINEKGEKVISGQYPAIAVLDNADQHEYYLIPLLDNPDKSSSNEFVFEKMYRSDGTEIKLSEKKLSEIEAAFSGYSQDKSKINCFIL